jgi:hypothetical protein
MKNIILISLTIISMAFRNAGKIGACIYILRPTEVRGQNIINYTDIPNHKYHLLVTNTVGTTNPSNALSVFTCSKDTMWMFLGNIKFSGIATGTAAILPSSKIMWGNSSKMLTATDFSLITIPYSQVTGTPSIPGIYTLTAVEIFSALTYTPYSNSNPAGYISGYIETDPLFNSKFSGKTTADLPEGSNLYFTAARTRTAVSAGTGISYNSGTGIFTTSKRQEAYSGVTNALGNYTVTFASSFSVAPNIQVNPVSVSSNIYIRTTVSATGFTVNAFARGILTVPLVGDVLAGNITNVVGTTIDVVVTEK